MGEVVDVLGTCVSMSNGVGVTYGSIATVSIMYVAIALNWICNKPHIRLPHLPSPLPIQNNPPLKKETSQKTHLQMILLTPLPHIPLHNRKLPLIMHILHHEPRKRLAVLTVYTGSLNELGFELRDGGRVGVGVEVELVREEGGGVYGVRS